MLATCPRPRTIAGVAVVLLLGIVLSACGSSEGASGNDESRQSESDITIEHKFGSTRVPADPRRVVSLGYTEQDALVLFDVQPIAELDPDLIMGLTAGLTDVEYEKLSQIAPTVVQPAEYPDFATPWQVQTLVTGEVFGQRERAEEIVAEVESLFDAAVDAHPELEGTTLALSGPSYEGQYPFHASGDARTRFFLELGLEVPDELDEIAGDRFYGGLSREQASMLDTDVLVWQSGSDAERSEIEADPVLSALPVVRDGRSLFIEGDDYAALQFMSALSLPHLLESFVPQLAEAVGGT